MQKYRHHIPYFIVIALLGSFVFVGVARAWTNPTQAPPGGSGAVTAESGAPAGSLYIDVSGAIGVSTANPQSTLDVNGTVRAQQVCDESGANCKDISAGWGSGYWSQSGANVYYNAGNVGIGTSSPIGKLDVSYIGGTSNFGSTAGGNNKIWVRSTGGSAGIWAGGSMGLLSTGEIRLIPNQTYGAENYNPAVTVTTGGSVGIGTSSPAQQLHLTGNMRVDGAIVAPEGTLRDDGGGWVRTYGNTGWYNQTYAGGWYMTDGTWIRAYNDRSVYTGGGIIRSDASVRSPIFYDQNDTGYYVDPNGNSRLHDVVADYYESGTIDQGDCYHRSQNMSNGEFRCADGYYMAGLKEDGDGMDNIYCCHP